MKEHAYWLQTKSSITSMLSARSKVPSEGAWPEKCIDGPHHKEEERHVWLTWQDPKRSGQVRRFLTNLDDIDCLVYQHLECKCFNKRKKVNQDELYLLLYFKGSLSVARLASSLKLQPKGPAHTLPSTRLRTSTSKSWDRMRRSWLRSMYHFWPVPTWSRIQKIWQPMG